jgi:hypothetical protein
MKRTWMAAGLTVLLCLPQAIAAEADDQTIGAGSYFAAWTGEADDALAAPQREAATSFAAPNCVSESCDACGTHCYDLCGKGRLFGLFAPSDVGFWRFISPMTNPVYFEDPRTLTEARPIFIQHKIPLRAPLAGGDVQIYAVQLRAALSENLSVIATKDGFIVSGANGPAQDGWANVNAGLKYNLYKDYDLQRIVSAAVVFEMPVGSTRALQGNGSGVFDLILTGAAQINEYWRTVSAVGIKLPSDVVDNSQSAYWSLHFDRTLGTKGWYFLTEYNWYHWLRSGEGGIPGIEGLDFYNFGSTGVAGHDIVTGSIGLKYKPNAYREYGVCWEAPLTDRRDILDNRLTVDAIFRF